VALKSMSCVAMVAALASACGRQTAAPPAPEADLEALSVTRWSEKTELFAEYAPLVVGQTSRFAIHLTRLDSFKALTAGQVEVRLTGASGPAEVFLVEAPSRPGIFGVDVKPARAGARELTIGLRLAGLDDEHRLGSVSVYPDSAAARSASKTDAGGADGISFLKEQQWALDFGTAVVRSASVRESVRVPAQIVARPGGAADVVAPIDGRLVRVLDAAVGAMVTQGQELARLLPPPGSPGELPQLRQAQAEAASAVQLATRDRERAERLVAAGAAPQKRLDEARAAEVQAQARVTGTEARLAQFNTARSAGAGSTDAGLFVLRAPLGGAIAVRSATTGANVVAGSVLFRVIDASQVHVAGQVPETDLARARQVRAAELETPGEPSRLPVGRLSGIGRVLDPRTRTVPITFALDNSRLSLALGQTVFLHLLADEAPPHPVVPVSAVVDDAGRPMVFVQREGETFERRAVTLGARSGDVVQVLDGVKDNERVVTRGAYLVRLASLSTQVPSHGHVH
jgi:membrane fusion protein, heavy metal efflux system